MIGYFMTAGIVILGVLTGFKLLDYTKKFDEILGNFRHIKETDFGSYTETLEKEGSPTVRSSSGSFVYNRSMLEANRDEYNRIYAEYVAYAQMIPIFTLLGILGTVVGLMLSSTDNVESLVKGLGAALLTTLAGLICSIALKIYDATKCGVRINLIDAEFAKADSIITRQTLKEEVNRARASVR